MGLHEVVKSAYLSLGDVLANNRLRDYKWFAEQEVNSWQYWVDFPLGYRLWLWRHGFPSTYGKLYDIETYGPDAFVIELQRYRFYKSINGSYRYLVDDKLSQHRMLSEHPDNRPTAYGFIDRGFLHGTAETTFEGAPEPVGNALPSMARTHGKLVLKQLRGKGGKEVLICEYDDGFLLDGEPISEAGLADRLAALSGYLVTEYVEQHDYASDLYPHSPNTIRLLTIWDDEVGELLTPMAVHRIGTERSRPIDNFSVGGIAAEIDLETGRLGEAVQFPFDGEVNWYRTHPDTGDPIAGEAVPDWRRIRSTVETIALEHTNVPAIGWDVIVDRAGEPVIIEANTGTDFDMMQVHRPFLLDADVARVVSRHLDDVAPPPSGGPETRPPVPVSR